MNYVITTDTSADLPEEYYQKHNLTLMSLACLMGGETYVRGQKEIPLDEFYTRVRAGEMPTTSQVNPEEAYAVLEPLLKEGKDILHIAFSSGLSGTYNSARIAAEELSEKYPERKIIVIDSLCASMGQGLLVHKALLMQEQGKDMDEVAAWCEDHKLNVIHSFTVDDLFHLHRGGRVSKTAAVLGTLINLKPVLHVNNEGKLIPLSKVRGRKKSIQALLASMEEKMGSFRDQNDVIFISHGDCPEDAQYLKSLIEEKYGKKEFLINTIGPVIGSHSGPGTLALFFMGDNRE